VTLPEAKTRDPGPGFAGPKGRPHEPAERARAFQSPHLALAFAQLCFASLSIAGKLAFRGGHAVPPNALVMTRMVGGAIVFWLVARRSGEVRVERGDRALLVVCGLLGVVFNQVLFINGLQRTTAISANLIAATIPVFTALFAVLLGRERFVWTRALGIALALGGVLVLFDVRNLSTSRAHLVGNAMCLSNCASYALFLVLTRRLSAKYGPMTLVALMFTVAAIAFAPFGIVSWVELAPRVGARELGLLAFIVAFPTVGAYAAMQWGLRRVESSLVATYIYLQPLFATIGAVLILDEPLRASAGAAAALIFLGVWVSTRRARAASPP
jgi:drug/metabolite transporter (DMT)-like permease